MRRIQYLVILLISLTMLPTSTLAQGDVTSPAGPTLISPADASTGSAAPTFSWQPVETVLTYRIEIASDDVFTSIVATADVSNTSYQNPTAFEAGAVLYWRVGSLGVQPDPIWSAVWSYVIEFPATETPQPTPTESPTDIPTESPTQTATPAATETSEPTSTSTSTPTSQPTSIKPTATRTPTSTGTPKPQQEFTPVTRSELSGKLKPAGYALTGVGRSDGSVHPSVLTDRDTGTIWTSPATHPGSAYIVLSLDSVKSIGEIKWLMGKTGRADQIRISVSADRVTWTEVGRARNAAVGDWQTLRVSVKARYVRFIFVNIRGDRWLGGLVEVEVHAPKAKPDPTPTTPSPTPVEDGIVRNASFENGVSPWYLENGARISSSRPRTGTSSLAVTDTGGYADQRLTVQAGTTYELSVWGLMTRKYDVAYIGISYRDANGKRLTDLEPAMLEFTANTWQKLSVQFSTDSRVARVNVFVWKLEGASGFFTDDLTLRVVNPASDDPPERNTVGCQGLLVPGYFDPETTSLWRETTATGTGVQFVIFNPNSGVGDRYDRAWSDVVESSRAAGFTVLAYVQTDYGSRSSASVIAEMDQYRDWYGVTDFFLDESDTRYQSVERYRTVVANIHRGGGLAVLNFGWMPNPAYMEFTDVAGVFEDGYAAYGDSYERPEWFYTYPPERFLHIVHSTPSSKWQTVIDRSRERNAGYVWVTDDDTVSYYKSLPSFWTKLNTTVRTGC